MVRAGSAPMAPLWRSCGGNVQERKIVRSYQGSKWAVTTGIQCAVRHDQHFVISASADLHDGNGDLP
jgi:hypothetical protein